MRGVIRLFDNQSLNVHHKVIMTGARGENETKNYTTKTTITMTETHN